jgi:hypothetical protein
MTCLPAIPVVETWHVSILWDIESIVAAKRIQRRGLDEVAILVAKGKDDPLDFGA